MNVRLHNNFIPTLKQLEGLEKGRLYTRIRCGIIALERLNDGRKIILDERKRKKEYDKEYGKLNKEKLGIKKHVYYTQNIKYFKNYHKNYNRKNKDKIKTKNRINYLRDRESAIRRGKESYKVRKIRRYEVISYYSNGVPQCACCGELEYAFLTIDHVNGRSEFGHDKKRTGSKFTGSSLSAWLRRNNYPEGFQILCFNCNSAKGHYGVCPHKNQKKLETMYGKQKAIV